MGALSRRFGNILGVRSCIYLKSELVAINPEQMCMLVHNAGLTPMLSKGNLEETVEEEKGSSFDTPADASAALTTATKSRCGGAFRVGYQRVIIFSDSCVRVVIFLNSCAGVVNFW